MELNTERKKLKKLYENLKELPFPKFSSQDELSGWIEELIEIDAFYAGLSLSVAEGEKISKISLCDLKEFQKALNFIRLTNKPTSSEDLEILKNCYNYLEKIQDIDSLLKKLLSY